jgi:two-component system, NtrC family, nitrogen regulation response regulator NtrX
LAFLGRDDGASGGATLEGEPGAPRAVGRLAEARDQFERDFILRALAAAHGNMSKTAEMLGVERSNLYKKMKAFGIAPRRDE